MFNSAVKENPAHKPGFSSKSVLHGDIKYYPEGYEVNQHGRSAKAQERKRDTRNGKKSHGHTHILDKVESEGSRQSYDRIREGLT